MYLGRHHLAFMRSGLADEIAGPEETSLTQAGTLIKIIKCKVKLKSNNIILKLNSDSNQRSAATA